jgi:subtilisin family serine protease
VEKSKLVEQKMQSQDTLFRSDKVVVVREGFDINDLDFEGENTLTQLKQYIEDKQMIVDVPANMELASHSESDEYDIFADTNLEKQNVYSAMAELETQEDVIEVQPYYLYETQWLPNAWDNNTEHWNYANTDLPDAFTTMGCPGGANCGGDNNVIVAVMDSGFAIRPYNDTGGYSDFNFTVTSPELTALDNNGGGAGTGTGIYYNTAEIPNNQIDDDCNGAHDDVWGFDAHAYGEVPSAHQCSGSEDPTTLPTSTDYTKVGYPTDPSGHGTLVASHIAGVSSDAEGVSPAFNVKLLPIAVGTHEIGSRSIDPFAIISGLKYIGSRGNVDVVNMSFGTLANNSDVLQGVISFYIEQLTLEQDITFVASSGNNYNSGNDTVFPASDMNVISVGAANSDNSRSSYSNTASNTDVVAYVGDSSSPVGNGHNIYQYSYACFFAYSPYTNVNKCSDDLSTTSVVYDYAIGTSFSAPQVSALAALVKSENPSYTPTQVKYAITNSATDIGASGWDKSFGWGVINFDNALTVNSPDTTPIFRFWNGDYRSHLYVIGTANRDNVLTNYPEWEYEQIAYYAYPEGAQPPGTTKVYRFWNPDYRSHLYVLGEANRDNVIDNYPEWGYEPSEGFYAYETAPADGFKKVHRFWASEYKSHFYTINTSQQERVLNDMSPPWSYEPTQFFYAIE